jgi:hypothetical protein
MKTCPLKCGDLVILNAEIYEPEIVEDWGIGIVRYSSPNYSTVSIFFGNKSMERVFHTKAVVKI